MSTSINTLDFLDVNANLKLVTFDQALKSHDDVLVL
jgi:hypothetical protein